MDHVPSSEHSTSSNTADCGQPHFTAHTVRICNLLSCTDAFVPGYPLRVYSHACVSDNANQCDTLFPGIQAGTQIPPPHSVQQALTADTQIHYRLFDIYEPVKLPLPCSSAAGFYLTNQRLLYMSLIEFIDIRFGPSSPVSSSALCSA